MLKSRSKWPPRGWQFKEAPTEWNLPQGLDFEQAVQAIVNHRLANRQHKKSVDPDVVAQELDDYTCARLKVDPDPIIRRSWSSYCVEATLPQNFPSPLPRQRSLRAEEGGVAGGVKLFQNTATGIKTWIDWFGEGKPVDETLAEKRAATCSDCPQNDQKKGVFAWFTGAVVREIKAIFCALNDLDLRTSHDDKLKVCLACDCPLRAKVWVPLHLAKKHVSKGAFERLDERCWMRHESEV
jgi:hypothetical protein